MCIKWLHCLQIKWFPVWFFSRLLDLKSFMPHRVHLWQGRIDLFRRPAIKPPMSFIRTLLILSLFPIALQAGSIVGNWRTIDDVSGKTKSIVTIYKTEQGDFEGKVSKIIHSDLGPNPICENCKGERHNQPIEGMVILWGLGQDSDTEWKGGEILDPKNGKIYKAKLRLRDDGKLEVRGFIGFSLIGRTQVWEPGDQ